MRHSVSGKDEGLRLECRHSLRFFPRKPDRVDTGQFELQRRFIEVSSTHRVRHDADLRQKSETARRGAGEDQFCVFRNHGRNHRWGSGMDIRLNRTERPPGRT